MAQWLVLGASSAIARAFARAVADTGDDLVLAGRDRDDLARSAADLRLRHGVAAETLAFDATAFESHADFAARVAALAPEADVFLAFGALYPQAALEADAALARRVIAVNYLGAVSVLTHLAPAMETRGRGRIVVMGSVAGDRGRPSNYVYGSAKAGLHTYLQGLRARLFRAGVSVTTVKAGFVDTAMTFGLPGMFLVAAPEAAAKAILRAAIAGRAVVYVPWFWRWIMLIIRAIPEPIFKRLPL